MIVVSCSSCGRAIQVMGDPKQIEYLVGSGSRFWPDKYVCPHCDAKAFGVEAASAPKELLAHPDMLLLEAEEMYAALNGLGLPDERMADCASVTELLTTKRVVRVGATPSRNPKRTHLEWLELEDGTRLYVSAGGAGAVVYRVRRRTSYAEKIDE